MTMAWSKLNRLSWFAKPRAFVEEEAVIWNWRLKRSTYGVLAFLLQYLFRLAVWLVASLAHRPKIGQSDLGYPLRVSSRWNQTCALVVSDAVPGDLCQSAGTSISSAVVCPPPFHAKKLLSQL
jgi:hypothetical protein